MGNWIMDGGLMVTKALERIYTPFIEDGMVRAKYARGTYPNIAFSVSVSADAKILVTGTYSSADVFIWMKNEDPLITDDYVQTQKITKASQFGMHMNITPDGKYLMVGSPQNHTLYVFKLGEDKQYTEIFKTTHTIVPGTALSGTGSISDDGKIIAQTAYPGTAILKYNEDTLTYEFDQQITVPNIKHEQHVLSADGNTFVVLRDAGQFVSVYRRGVDNLFELSQSFPVPRIGYAKIKMSKNGKTLVVTGAPSPDTNPAATIYTLDEANQFVVTQLIPNFPANGSFYYPLVSDDGNAISLSGDASNMTKHQVRVYAKTSGGDFALINDVVLGTYAGRVGQFSTDKLFITDGNYNNVKIYTQ